MIIGTLAFLLKIIIGAISVGVLVGVGYLIYRLVALIPDSRLTKPIKGWIFGGCMIALVICVVGFPFFMPGVYMFVQHINHEIPPILQFWHQATG